MISSLPWIDISIVILIFLSGIVGFARGFTREILGLLSWGGALALSLWGGPYIRPFLTPYLSSSLVASLVAGILVFITALLILVLLSKEMSHHIKGTLLAGLDRTFGFLFGLARGYLLVILAYMALAFLVKPTLWPESCHISRFFLLIIFLLIQKRVLPLTCLTIL